MFDSSLVSLASLARKQQWVSRCLLLYYYYRRQASSIYTRR